MALGNPFDQQKKIEGVKNIILVGAGKGGVGKSTVSANLAYALSKRGLKIGLLDADIYGPSVPTMTGTKDVKPNLDGNRKILPISVNGIKTMSLGYLIDDNAAVIWRGPMLFKAIDQFLRDVMWGELDVLLVDLPPGTGDVQLTIAQKVPVNGAVIVSTPQNISLIDVKRCVDMFQKVKIPVLGLVENMASIECCHCHKTTDLFPKGELENYLKEKEITLLAQIPFRPQLAVASEKGEICNLSDFEQPASEIYKQLF